MRYGQDNSVFANMDMYQIENVVCYPFRTATLVDNETIEGQIGEGCWTGRRSMHTVCTPSPSRNTAMVKLGTRYTLTLVWNKISKISINLDTR